MAPALHPGPTQHGIGGGEARNGLLRVPGAGVERCPRHFKDRLVDRNRRGQALNVGDGLVASTFDNAE